MSTGLVTVTCVVGRRFRYKIGLKGLWCTRRVFGRDAQPADTYHLSVSLPKRTSRP